MDKNKIGLTLADCLEYWRDLGVLNLAWLEKEDPMTVVEYIDIPDLVSWMSSDEKDKTIPGWTFETSQGAFRFTIENNRLYPESVIEPDRGNVNHRSRFFDMQSDVERNIFGGNDRSNYRTDFGYGVGRLIHGEDEPSGKAAIDAWLTFSDFYHTEMNYVVSEYKRRKSFAQYIDITTRQDDGLYNGFLDVISYMVRGDKYIAEYKSAYVNPEVWSGIEVIPMNERVQFFLKTWDLPGAPVMLSKLAPIWGIKGWTMLESLTDTDNFAIEAIQSDKHVVQNLVNNALGVSEQSHPDVTLPVFD